MQHGIVESVQKQGSQRTGACRHADSHEAEERLQEYRRRDAQHDLGHQLSYDVRNDIPEYDMKMSRSHGTRCLYIFQFLDLHYLSPGDTAHFHPARQHQGQDDGTHAGFQDQHEECHHYKGRNTSYDIDDSLHQDIRHATEVP